MSSREITCRAIILARVMFVRCYVFPICVCILGGPPQARSIFKFLSWFLFSRYRFAQFWIASLYSCMVVDFLRFRPGIRFTIGSVSHCILRLRSRQKARAVFHSLSVARCVFCFDFCPFLYFSCIFCLHVLFLDISIVHILRNVHTLCFPILVFCCCFVWQGILSLVSRGVIILRFAGYFQYYSRIDILVGFVPDAMLFVK